MSTLLKQDDWCYSQFYCKERSPKRKRIALKTKTKRTAQKIHKKLEDKYAYVAKKTHKKKIVPFTKWCKKD